MRITSWAIVVCLAVFAGCKRDKPLPKEVVEAPPQVREPVRKALESGKVEVPPAIRELAPPAPAAEEGDIALLSPESTYVASATPTFRWQRDERSQAYQVRIWDASGKKVVESPWTDKAEWKCETPLAPGGKYEWQVAGKGKRGERISPKASFQVPAEDVLKRLEEARRSLSGNDMALAVVYAREGAVDEAQRLLAAYIVKNPTSEEAKKLYKSLRAQRVELTKK